MRLDDCDLDSIDAISIAPFERNAPEDEWQNAAKDGTIPSSLYDLYCRAGFLSFGASPRFLSDSDNVLFSYFALVLRSVQESLIDAHEQVDSFVAVHELVYDPMKQLRGERWEKGADIRERRHFRDLLIALQTAFDALADVIAIFFPGCIKRLEVGRAQFSKVEAWLNTPPAPTSLILTPSEFYLTRLRRTIEPLVHSSPPETNWLPMMRLLRNKSAHLGQPLFRQIGLPRIGDGKLFVFIPRKWPYIWERLIKPADQSNPSLFPQMLRDGLIHQDIVTYSRGLLSKVQTVIAETFTVLNEAYEQFKDLPSNEAALMQLENSSESYDFENFTNV
ncbi:MAG TPA: hypothetical protein VIH89_05590 [Candidatus Sulfotelmatobacter sp.]